MSWRPIETAPKDGTPVLVILSADIFPGLGATRPDLERWNGIQAVMRNRGDASDWCFAAPVGHGGFPDEWIAGWQPLPAPPGGLAADARVECADRLGSANAAHDGCPVHHDGGFTP